MTVEPNTKDPGEIACRTALAALAAAPRPVRPEVDKPVVPHVYFSWDSEAARVEMELLAEPGAVVALTAAISGRPRWVCMSVALGPASWGAGQALGLAWSVECDTDFAAVPFLRSRGAGGSGDTYFGDPLALGNSRKSGVSLLGLDGGDAAVGADRFHTLILPLPSVSFTLRLWDLRLFLRAPPTGAVLAVARLGSAAQ